MFKKGQVRLSLVAETEYRDSADRSAKKDAAAAAGQPTADEAKKSSELAKKMVKSDGGADLMTFQAEHQKLHLRLPAHAPLTVASSRAQCR